MKILILEEAIKTVRKREDTHGECAQNHLEIANLWSAYLGKKLHPRDVALMMVLVKIARTKANSRKTDHYVDMAGYAAIAGQIGGAGLTDVMTDKLNDDETRHRSNPKKHRLLGEDL